MIDGETLGLREQKRLATRRALQVALLKLALERGFENVTVDEVGRAANVSPRTFFNYFTSKEDAVIGRGKPFEPTDEAVERFRRGTGDVVSALVDLVAGAVTSTDDPIVYRLRRRLLEQEPGLLGVQVAGVHRLEERLALLIAERLQENPVQDAGCTHPGVSHRARLLALMTGAILRSGWGRWIADEGARPFAEYVRDSHAQFRRECAGLASDAARSDLAGVGGA